ncbi:MAG: ABC transporter ATP-binding protein/permease [Oscillospiraceae bacterium]|nr:ABC transporter ATP-binding protein/permease [Oscillospiraceae bacterium]
MKLIFRLLKIARPWAKYLIISTAAVLVVSGTSLLVPHFIRQVIALMETTALSDAMGEISPIALLLLGTYILQTAARFFAGYYGHVGSWRLVAHMRSRLYDHLQSLSMSYYHDKQTGQLMARVTADTATFETLIAHSIPDIIIAFITLIGVLTILLFINPTLTLLVCIPIPFIAAMSTLLRKMRKNFRRGQKTFAEVNAILQDNFSGIKEIQVFNKQSYESSRVREKTQENAATLIKALFYSAVLNPGVALVTSLGTVIVLFTGPLIAQKTGLAIADVVAFLLYLNLFYAPVSTLARTAEDVQQSLAGAERVFEVLDTPSDITDAPNAQKAEHLTGQVSFENVSFAYQEGITVLEDISFEVKAGQMVALIGPTGVGKSTISSLIARFYDPTAGKITMDGMDIKTMTLESLRNQLSLVLQDVFLFNGTIAENIAYGCDSATPQEIAAAARTACIADYIENLPEGYDTVIGERGVRLSGGQKQRISIARSVLRGSPILILDEATSSVDTETEREIQSAIAKIAGTRTLLVIAHRLSTIKKADLIIAIQDGKIAEQGTHSELIARGGVYAGMVHRV